MEVENDRTDDKDPIWGLTELDSLRSNIRKFAISGLLFVYWSCTTWCPFIFFSTHSQAVSCISNRFAKYHVNYWGTIHQIARVRMNNRMVPDIHISRWRHQMETFSVLLAICAGNSPVPAQRPVTRSFDVFFDLRLINDWVNNREAGDLRRYCAHYYVIVG